MGRWAQAHRRGGGRTTPNSIIAAVGPTGSFAVITYEREVPWDQLLANTFESSSSGEVGDTINPIDARSAQLIFTGDITGDTSVTYTGNVPGILTPQTKTYS
jgi:hypothetical protein